MKAFFYYVIYGLFRVFTWLPLSFSYLISDLLAFLAYYLVAYRKTVVVKNLKASFPEKSKQEIRILTKKFYRHFTDLFVESIYILHMDPAEASKRFSFKNPELLSELYSKNKSIILLIGHYGNWEWLNVMELLSPYHVLGIYKPLENKYFDKLFIRLREKFGVETVPMTKILRRLLVAEKNREGVLSLFLYDQRPRGDELNHWLSFMNQDTPVMVGAEKIAGRTRQSVVFLNTRKTKRGYYEGTFELIQETAEPDKDNVITHQYYKLLEKMIRQAPEYWLWSHDRWKYSR